MVSTISGTTRNHATASNRSRARGVALHTSPPLRPRQAMKQIIHRAQRLSSGIAPLSPGVGFRATRKSYDDALLIVSDILAEAEVHAEAGSYRVARRLYGYAGQLASTSGFAELEQLVRAYRPNLDGALPSA